MSICSLSWFICKKLTFGSKFRIDIQYISFIQWINISKFETCNLIWFVKMQEIESCESCHWFLENTAWVNVCVEIKTGFLHGKLIIKTVPLSIFDGTKCSNF